MTVYFTRLLVGHPNKRTRPPDLPESWCVYTICTKESPKSCQTIADVNNLGSVSDQKKARLLFSNHLDLVKSGHQLSDLYDGNALHEAHSFNHNHHRIVIKRIRRGDIRTYILTPTPPKRIIFLRTIAKRTDDLTNGEKTQLENIIKFIWEYLPDAIFQKRVIK